MATYVVPDDYATIQLAVSACSHLTADTVRVRVGTYAEDIDLRVGGLRPVTIEAYDPANPPTISGAGGSQTFRADSTYLVSAVGTATLRNLIVTANAANGVVYANSSAVNVYGCTFVSSSSNPTIRWLFGSSTRPGIVEGCTFTGTSGEAVIIGGGSTDYVQVRNCVIKRTAPTTGQIAAVSVSDGLVYNVSIYVSGATGSLTSILAKTVTNTVVQATGGTLNRGIRSGTYTTCDVYGTITTPYYGGVDGGGNLTADPLFTDPGTANLLPAPGSPLISAGTNLAGTFTDSYNDVTRPGSGAWTIGAYEVPATTTVSSVTVLGPTSLRLNLADTVTSDSTWTTAGNYTVTPSGGAAAVTVSAAVVSTATTITLTTSEHTNGGSYEIAWAGLTNITDGDLPYTGQGVAPTVSAAAMTAGKTVRVTFSESMANNAALTTTGNYTVTGATVSAVTRVDATRVDVTIAQRIPLATSAVTVNGPQDLALNPVSNSSQSFAVPYLTMVSGTAATRDSVAVTFNVAPTSGVSDPDDWTVTPTSGIGDAVVVTSVSPTSSTVYALTVWPQMDVRSYTIAAPSAANASGAIG